MGGGDGDHRPSLSADSLLPQQVEGSLKGGFRHAPLGGILYLLQRFQLRAQGLVQGLGCPLPAVLDDLLPGGGEGGKVLYRLYSFLLQRGSNKLFEPRSLSLHRFCPDICHLPFLQSRDLFALIGWLIGCADASPAAVVSVLTG
jgi:hypothetical protein